MRKKFNAHDLLLRRLPPGEPQPAGAPASEPDIPYADSAQSLAIRLGAADGASERAGSDALLQQLHERGMHQAINRALERQRAHIDAGYEPLDWALLGTGQGGRCSGVWSYDPMPFPRPFSRRLDDPLGLLEAGVAGRDARMIAWTAWSVDAQHRLNPVVVVRDHRNAWRAWVVSAAHRWLAILNSEPRAAIDQMMRQDCAARSLEEHATQALLHGMGLKPAEPGAKFSRHDELFLTVMNTAQFLQSAAIEAFFWATQRSDA